MQEPENSASRPRMVVLFPFPFQGHVTPMLHLGSLLHSRGFPIALVTTAPLASPPPQFTLFPLQGPDFTASSGAASLTALMDAVLAANDACRGPFEELMTSRMHGRVACVVYDPVWRFVGQVAARVGVPTMVMRGTSAAYVHALLVLMELAAQRLIPLPESQMQVPIDPLVHPLRFKDLSMPATEEIPEATLDFQRTTMGLMKSSSAIIWNTTNELDHASLCLLQPHLPIPFFSIGPLHKMAPPLPTSLLQEDTMCLSWLDKHPPNSVIYVCLGSLAKIDEMELKELAWGLAMSKQPFLWAIRPTALLNGAPKAIDSLSKDFREITREKGCIVDWAPQKRVLAHPAIGGFLSHCGWNSTLESMCEGVPLLCRPCFADQWVNARYVTHVWKVGLELENATENSIKEGIGKLMVSEDGKRIRHEALNLKQVLEQSINGGSSYKSLNQMVEFITSFQQQK